jgi:hypothetical protein
LEIEEFIFYLSHRQVVLSRGTHRKSLLRGQSLYFKPFKILSSTVYRTCLVNPPDTGVGLPVSRDGYWTSLVPPLDLSGLWPTSRGSAPASRAIHRTCPVNRTCPVWGPAFRAPRPASRGFSPDLSSGPDKSDPDQLPENFTGLVWCPIGLVR